MAFHTEDGLELLVHVGLETVSSERGVLQGSCESKATTVKAGDLVAEVDLEYLAEKKINPITPVLICCRSGRIRRL